MNRRQRRFLSKAKPIKKSKHGDPTRMLPFEAKLFLEPLETFIDQILKHEVWVDHEGNALMDLPDESVEVMVKQGKNPRRASDNIIAMMESYFQVVAYCGTDDELQVASDNICFFSKRILNRIKVGCPIEREDVLTFKNEKLKDMYRAYLTYPRDKINEVNERLIMAIKTAPPGPIDMLTLRQWLMDKLEGV